MQVSIPPHPKGWGFLETIHMKKKMIKYIFGFNNI